MINLIRLAIINFLLVSSLVAVYPRIYPKQTNQQVLPSSISLISITPSPTLSEPTPLISKPIPAKAVNPTPTPIPSTTLRSDLIGLRAGISGPTLSPTPPTQGGDIASHNKQSDCWITYSGGTYNITAYFGKHPGGDIVIAQMCGKDITTVFNAVPHSSRAKQLLETYRM